MPVLGDEKTTDREKDEHAHATERMHIQESGLGQAAQRMLVGDKNKKCSYKSYQIKVVLAVFHSQLRAFKPVNSTGLFGS